MNALEVSVKSEVKPPCFKILPVGRFCLSGEGSYPGSWGWGKDFSETITWGRGVKLLVLPESASAAPPPPPQLKTPASDTPWSGLLLSVGVGMTDRGPLLGGKSVSR